MGSQGENIPRIAVTSVKVEQSKLDRLTEIAALEHRTRAQQIRYLIDRCIAESERGAA